jgi:glycosyltransferase involved in cell wall biosynthesis
MPSKADINKLARDLGCCVIIPTYNNSGTLKSVIEDVRSYISDIIVINDGSTDKTSDILSACNGIKVVSYEKNRGKGYALKQGFRSAYDSGFRYAITIDSDGQHLASDIKLFLDTITEKPDSLIVGTRLLAGKTMSGGSTFANKFSNFWFRLQTGIDAPDTQSGFRLYPLRKISRIRFLTNRYEAELEMLVRSSWRGITLISVPINVYYPPIDQRVTHFRPYKDFIRISILNTFFTILAFTYAYPRKLIMRIINTLHQRREND